MRKILKKVNETGTLLVEAMAMLGLIAMVTPVLYKKASERTVELQDVNASAQMRALSTAIDGYLKDNFARITKGEKITDSAGHELDFSGFKNAAAGQVGPVSITHFGDYLPYGFLKADGSPRETKIFDDEYNVIIKLESDIQGGKVLSQTLTGFVTATPKIPDEIGSVRASRIASMIGSNGGYVTTEGTEQVAMGAQGIWSVPTSELGGGLVDNSFVVSSVQPISSQGLANEDVLHRKNEPDAADELNTMETDLFMGYTVGDTRNIRLVNQIIMHPNVDRMVKGADVASTREEDVPADTLDPAGFGNTLDKALYIAKGGGAYVEGALQAMNSLFTVKDDGIKYFATTNVEGPLDPATGTKPITTKRADKPVFKVASDEMVYGDPGAGKTKLTVKSAGSMTFGTSAVPANGTTPAQPEGETLYADKDKFRAGDGHLNVFRDSTAGNVDYRWYTVIKKDDGVAKAHKGEYKEYVWTGDTPEPDAMNEGFYALSVNGAAFVKDTLLTGKLKALDVDASTLRGGVAPENFATAENDTDFYTVAKMDQDGGRFIVGTNEIPMMTISDTETTDNNGRVIPGGVSISTADALDGARGVDISAGASKLIYYDTENEVFKWSDVPEDNLVRIGGIGGVNISARNEAGSVSESPVSIQGEMFRAFKSGNYNTITTHTQQFNMLSKWLYDSYSDEQLLDPEMFGYYRHSPSAWGRVYMADSGFIIASTSGKPVVDISPSASNTTMTSRFVGSLALYDTDFDARKDSDVGNNSTFVSASQAYGATANLYATRGVFQIRDYNKTYADGDIEAGTNTYRSNKVNVFTVGSTGALSYLVSDSNRLSKNGSVYIRRGSMALESNVDETNNRKLTNTIINTQYENGVTDAVGYIAADRFISHYKPSDILSSSNIGNEGGYALGGGTKKYVPYDGYEVNPAYTSVMHDIKLTTRGGARLSDILPDFINKGIYVVDTTYDPNVTWTPNTVDIPTTEVGENAGNEVSPYAGFIPTPQCPPGYAKSITLTPAGWNMAVAGRAIPKGDGKLDIVPNLNINSYADVDPVTGERYIDPLEFQKSTWLRAMVLPYCGKFQEDSTGCTRENFGGWGAVLGFIYPAAHWTESLGVLDTDIGQDDVYWNLFPVHFRELEGYATVYCYFDRSSFNYDEVYNDYDQLKARGTGSTLGSVNSYKKDGDDATTYIDRLNDPKLKYYDPW